MREFYKGKYRLKGKAYTYVVCAIIICLNQRRQRQKRLSQRRNYWCWSYLYFMCISVNLPSIFMILLMVKLGAIQLYCVFFNKTGNFLFKLLYQNIDFPICFASFFKKILNFQKCEKYLSISRILMIFTPFERVASSLSNGANFINRFKLVRTVL